MCTLIAAVSQFEGYPLLVAANRDEQLNRPSSAPRIWKLPVPFLAPRDDVRGGTWLGLNRAGLFVGVTNRYGIPVDSRRASRGALVVEALRSTSAQALHQQLSTLASDRFNAFHLFYADAEKAFVTWSDGQTVRQQSLEPGLHVISEGSFGGEDHGRTELIRSRWTFDQVPDPEALASILRVHQEGHPLASTCVHAPAFNYGTRSSLVLFRATDLAQSRIHWGEGPACQAHLDAHPKWIKTLVATSPAN